MSNFFDFVDDLEFYEHHDKPVPRLNKRYRFLIEPFKDELKDAKVLDLASHDGRWAYALAGAGARRVIGIEARREVAQTFELYPETDFKHKVRLRVEDLFEGIAKDIEKGKTYDVIAVFGIYYHIMDHFGLLQALNKLQPKLIIIDSEFIQRDNQVIQLVQERTDNILNAAPQIEGQKVAIKGIPTFKAMEAMAEALDYDLEWQNWRQLGDRTGVHDYYRQGDMRRGTCALRPRAKETPQEKDV